MKNLRLVPWAAIARIIHAIDGPMSPGCIRWMRRRYGVEWGRTNALLARETPRVLTCGMDRPKLGDYFRAAGMEGTVTEIDMFASRKEAVCQQTGKVLVEKQTKAGVDTETGRE